MLRVSTYFNTVAVVRSNFASVSVARAMLTYKGDMSLALGETSKEPSSSTTSTDTSFNDVSNEETRNVNSVYHQ